MGEIDSRGAEEPTPRKNAPSARDLNWCSTWRLLCEIANVTSGSRAEDAWREWPA
jgi:hypothetical protein